MKFNETSLQGAYIIEREPYQDFRGSFARTFCTEEFRKCGLKSPMVQSNLSVTLKKNTIRGMHYQVNGAEEDKLVLCLRGAILDVILDTRNNSETFGQHIKIELTESNNRMLYVPKGFAHGYLTLKDDCHVFYQVSNFYNAAQELGIRWNDPFFKVDWPIVSPIVSEKDSRYRDFEK